MTKPSDRAIAQAFLHELPLGHGDAFFKNLILARAREIDAAAPEGEPGPEAMRVIHPAEWEPCTPEYLLNGGSCDAPRVWHAEMQNHWHPKRKPEGAQGAVAWQRRIDHALDGTWGEWRECSQQEHDSVLALLGGRSTARMAGAFNTPRGHNILREDEFGWPTQVRALYTAPPQPTEAARDREDAETRQLAVLADIRKAIGDDGKLMQDELVAAVAKLAEDAERYRWLRDVRWDQGITALFELRYGPEEWDAAIDAARAAGGCGRD